MNTIYVNGKFTAQRVTGVQRVAGCLLQALDRTLAEAPHQSGRWVLLCPPGGRIPELQCIEVRQVGSVRFGLHAWEQLALPLASRGGALLSLAGSAPLFKGLQACTFHDAAIFDHPQAYTRSFVAWYRFLFRSLSRRARLVITVSEFSRQRLLEQLRMPADQLVVVRNGAEHLSNVTSDPSVLTRLGVADSPFLLAVGSANPTKNFRAMIEAFQALPPEQGEVRLVVVGGTRGPVFSATLLPQAEPRVLYAGPVTDAQLKSLYQHAGGLVFPSLYEGYGLPPLEAMSCGCPVAASHAAAIPEVCAGAALYFDPHSVPDMTAAMVRLLSEPRLREVLRRRGEQRVRQLTWQAAAGELLGHLDAHGLTAGAAA